MKILPVVLMMWTLVMSSAMPATAQPVAPSPEATLEAKRLLAVMSPDMMKDMHARMFAQVWPPMEQAFRTRLGSLDAATAAGVLAEIRAALENQLFADLTTVMDAVPAIYARYLTVAEMRDIEAFYRTPTGAKTLKIMPEAMTEMMGIITTQMPGMMQRMDAAASGVLRNHGIVPQ